MTETVANSDDGACARRPPRTEIDAMPTMQAERNADGEPPVNSTYKPITAKSRVSRRARPKRVRLMARLSEAAI